jgi:hypothetical protein
VLACVKAPRYARPLRAAALTQVPRRTRQAFIAGPTCDSVAFQLSLTIPFRDRDVFQCDVCRRRLHAMAGTRCVVADTVRVTNRGNKVQHSDEAKIDAFGIGRGKTRHPRWERCIALYSALERSGCFQGFSRSLALQSAARFRGRVRDIGVISRLRTRTVSTKVTDDYAPFERLGVDRDRAALDGIGARSVPLALVYRDSRVPQVSGGPPTERIRESPSDRP